MERLSCKHRVMGYCQKCEEERAPRLARAPAPQAQEEPSGAPAPAACPNCQRDLELVAKTVDRIKYLEEVERKFEAHVCPQPPAPTSPAGRDHGKALAQYLIRSIPTPHTEEIEVTDELMDLIQAANGGTFDRATPEAGSPAAGESQGAKLPNLEQLSPAEHRDLLRRAGPQEGGSQP